MPSRVLLAGSFHETHTFLDGVTTLEQFECRRGGELLDARGDGSPLAGVVESAAEFGWELLPTIDLRATPSAVATDDVLTKFWTAVADIWQAEQSRGIDAVYLVLHGAMVTESCRDVEGEILARLRALPGGAEVPVCGVLDLHGNISQASFVHSDGFVAYQKNPHTDAHSAACNAARLLQRILTNGVRPQCVWAQCSIVWPPTGTGTADSPMQELLQRARDIEAQQPDIFCVNVFAGFSFADTPDTGVSVSAITFGDQEIAMRELSQLCALAEALQQAGDRRDQPLFDVWPLVTADIAAGRTPVLLVEPSDNIGGGAPGDGTTILRELLARGIGPAAVVIDDAVAVAELLQKSPGERCTIMLGGRGSSLTDGPVSLTDCLLVRRSDGRFDLEDPHSHLASMAGVHIDMGPSVVLQADGVHILVTSRKTPPFDLGQLRSQGIVPEHQAVIAVKAAVAHRQAYDPIAGASYTVSTPGPCSSDLRTLPWQHIRRPVFPLDK